MKNSFTLLLTFLITISVAIARQGNQNTGHRTLPFSSDHGRKTNDIRGVHSFVKMHCAVQETGNQLKSNFAVKQQLDSTFWLSADLDKREWVSYYKEKFAYNMLGQNTQYSEYDWDVDLQEWVPYVNYSYEYDGSGDMVLETERSYDFQTGDWLLSSKNEYSYNASHLPIQMITYGWDSYANEWIASTKEEYQYDGNGFPTIAYQYQWDNNQWIYSAKIEYDCNTTGQLLQAVCYYYEYSSSQWLTYYKDDYYYDGNNRLINLTESDWDETGSEWIPSWKEEYAYDSNNNVDIEHDYWWDTSTNQWIPDFLEDYSYNNTYSFYDLILPYVANEAISMFFNHMLTNIDESVWNEGTASYSDITKGTFYYSQQDYAAVTADLLWPLSIYPNPVTNNILIDLPAGCKEAYLELFDNAGRRVMTAALSGNQQIDVSYLGSGLYYYIILFKGEIKTGKILKK